MSKQTTKTAKAAESHRPAKASKNKQSKAVPIAVVGVSALFPGSVNADGYWRDILAGKDQMREVPPTHWLIEDNYDPNPRAVDKTYGKTGAFIDHIDFNPMEFSIPPANLASTDTSQLLALVVAKKVLEDAFNNQFHNMDRDKISVVLGVAAGLELLGEMAGRLQRPVWVKALREEGLPEHEVQSICDRITSNFSEWKESTFPGVLGNVVAGRIANHFDLGGVNCTVDAACASSFSAMSLALNELYLGNSDLVITGGVDTCNDPFLYTCFSKTPALSLTGDCRPFSDDADGMTLGEGIGMVALKRLEDAERDNDRIYAVIKGLGASSDGGGTSVYAPLPKGQAKALRRAYEAAGYGPETVELVEAHGTGTIAGDTVEFQGLNIVFSESNRKDKQWCALGSVKSQIGHTKSAAAVAGLIKAVMAVHHKTLPPTIKVNKPDPKFKIEDTAFYLNTKTRPWIRTSDHPRRASVSSFGFGGTNFHVTLEEYTGKEHKAYRLRSNPAELVLFTGKTPGELMDLCMKTTESLDIKGILYYLARSGQENFDTSHPARLAVIAEDEKDLEAKLKKAIEKIEKNPDTSFSFPNGMFYHPNGMESGGIAFIFPGQGSQYINMGTDLAVYDKKAHAVWEMAASIPMDEKEGLHDVVFPRPVFTPEEEKALLKKLTQTQWAQPAICATSLSMLEVLKPLGITPDAVGGHSLGEVTALYAAGVITEEDLLKVARKRGELMAQAASTPGTMTAVAQPTEKIQALLDEWKSDVIIANHNSPKQVVLSGTVEAIEDVEKRLSDEGISPHRLQVSTAFHSSLMTGSCEPFSDFLKTVTFTKPELSVYSNAEAAPYPKKVNDIRGLLTKQINHPVRFVEQIKAMYDSGVRTFLEIGPGSVLTKLVDQCLGNKPHLAVSIDRKGSHGVTNMFKALGQLVVNGVNMDFSALWEDYRPCDDPREKKKPLMTVPIAGYNYGRPYPPAEGASALPKPNPPRKVVQEKSISLMQSKKQTPEIKKEAPLKPEKTETKPMQSPPATAQQNKPAVTPVQAPATGRAVNPAPQHQPKPPAFQSQHTQPTGPRPVAPMNTGNGNNSAWLSAFQEIQQQTAESYISFQKAMTETHLAFLNNAETTNRMLGAMIGIRTDMPGEQMHTPMYNQTSPAVSQNMPTAPVYETAPQQPAAAHTPVQETAPAPAVQEPTMQPAPGADKIETPAPDAHKPAPVQADSPVPEDIDFTEMLLDVVAEKTGYPKEILDVNMDLEADLGIDSIKRVEIFSAVKDENPWLPEVDPSEMTDIRTLGDVLGFIENYAPQAAANAPAAQPTAPAQPTAEAVPMNIDFKEMLLDVVAEKTGYPKEILDVNMDLEADLGIDSIKRVEIFSAVKDENPWLPEVDPSEMTDIRTLGDVLKFIENYAPQAAASAPASQHAAAAAPAQPTADAVPMNIDFKEMLLDVVAEKTGYPKEILDVNMDLEADLGIDSIKRVEIFSAVKDENPWLPEVDPSEMTDIRTLGDVLKFIENYAPQAAANAPTAQSLEGTVPVAQTAAEAVTMDIDFKEMLLDVVAEKTGYPKDILDVNMELEADLGIDSIKRVEIFSAVKDENPWLPEVDPSEMTGIKTLGDVLTFIENYAPQATQPVAAGATPAAQTTTEAVPMNIDFKEMLLDVVAEKTGYPKDILDVNMELEADLGIDSIKRVEIFSAVKDENPWLPEVDPSEMTGIKTLGDVLTFIENYAPQATASAPAAQPTENGQPDSQQNAVEKHADSDVTGIGRYALREVRAPHSGFKMTGLVSGSSVVIIEDHAGVAQVLAERLKTRGLNAAVSEEIPENTDILIFLGGLRECLDEESAVSVNKEAFFAAKAVAPRFADQGGVFVTVQDTGGNFGLSGNIGIRAFLGGLSGLVKTAALEWPEASVKAIDLEKGNRSPEELADAIARELFTGGPEKEVGLHADGARYRLESYSEAPNQGTNTINENAVIVASGGARGVTAATLVELARQAKPSIALLGRTPLEEEPDFCKAASNDAALKRVLMEDAKAKGEKVTPADLGAKASKILAAREINATLAAISEAGGRACYIPCDVQNVEALTAAFESIRNEWGPITGIIHGAGVLTDKLIAEKTEAQFDRVFNTKVEGLRSLLRATENDPINMICFFSSIAARFGNFGQCDYAMANEILNKVANVEANQRNGKCTVKSINWGPWDGGMVSPLLKEHFAKMGVPLIPLGYGAEQLVTEVQESSQNSVEIVIGPTPPKGEFNVAIKNKEVNLSVLVNGMDYPFIGSHKIKDVPVVPVAMVLEWFSRAAHICRPDLDFLACKDLRVLRGISLNDFSNGGNQFTFRCRQSSNGNGSVMELEIPGMAGAPYYRATIEMVEKGQKNGKKRLNGGVQNLESWSWDPSEIYNNRLFHGPDFQVIRSLEGISESGASAILVGTETMNWPGEGWKTDVAAIDGGLQLAILWGQHQLGKQSLPTKIGSFFTYEDNLTQGPIRCELQGEIHGQNRTVSNISFYGEDGTLLAELCDVEMHMLPDTSLN